MPISIQKKVRRRQSTAKLLSAKMLESKQFPGKIALKTTQTNDGYRFLDMSILDNIISYLLCPTCEQFGLHISEDSVR